MLVTDRRRTGGRDLVDLVRRAVRGGAGLVQVRERDLEAGELCALARRIVAAVGRAAIVSINGSPEVARRLGLGLHLAARDPAPERREEGDAFWPRGRSIHDEEEARRAAAEGCDYVVLGTIHETRSKPGRPAAGAALVERVRKVVGPIPIYAIGGMTPARVAGVRHAGAYGVAACGALLRADDPQQAAAEFLAAWEPDGPPGHSPVGPDSRRRSSA